MVDPLLQAQLEAEAPLLFGAIEIELPSYTIRLVDGSAEVVIDGDTYSGEDATFGTIDRIDAINESMDQEAPEISVSFLPPDDAAAADLASSAMQGATVRIMLGALDPETGLVIGDVEQLFLGEVDVPTIERSQGRRSVTFTVVSVFERLFEIREGERASDGWHQSIWPGQLGLEFMTGTVKTLYWGAKRPVANTIGYSAQAYPGNLGI